MKSDHNTREINISLGYILNLEEHLLNQTSFKDFLRMLDKEVLVSKNLSFHGLYTSLEFETLGYDFKPEKIILDKMHLFIPIHDDEAQKIVLINQTKKQSLSELNYIIALIVSAGAFYSNKSVIEKKNKMFFNIFRSLVSAVDAKDSVTGNHSERVAEISVKIGELLGFSSHKIELLRIAGLIHDVGKIGIKENVLNKPCFYNDEDLIEMNKHPIIGAKILKLDEIDDEIYKTILQHHERVDGKGYPYGLKGNEISEFSKIVKIADVYDALTSKRQYKDVWELEKVVKIMKSESGTAFDEVILDVFIRDLSQNITENSNIEDPNDHELTETIPPSVFDIWKNCRQVIETNRSSKNSVIQLEVEDFFFNASIEFCNLKFGDHIMTRRWLNLKPNHAIAAVTNDFDYFTLQTKSTFQQAVFVFYKEFCNALYLETDTMTSNEIVAHLKATYGESEYSIDDFSIWKYQTLYVLLYENIESGVTSLMFIHKYCL